MKPLAGLLVVDFTQFLSGPLASLRLADLGARVIKIERPHIGDICRQTYASNVLLNGESTVFHAINRNKESFVADLKNEADCAQVCKLVAKADVVIHNFRPRVMQRLGFDYESVRAINPGVVYGEISGYGTDGPWKAKPGQDLLVQAITGLTWLSGNAGDGPVPMGLAVVDMFAGANLAQGLLACLLRKSVCGEGGLVQLSLLDSAIDLQLETITTYHRDGGVLPQRSASNNAHAYLGAPYGIYQTHDGYLALAMGEITTLGRLLQCDDLLAFDDPALTFDQRDHIKTILARHLLTDATDHWLQLLEPADVWCADVLTWERLFHHDGFHAVEMIQEVVMADATPYRTTRCPIRIDGEILWAEKGSPKLGEDNDHILDELTHETT